MGHHNEADGVSSQFCAAAVSGWTEAINAAEKVAENFDGRPCGAASGWSEQEKQFYDAGQGDASRSIADAIRELKVIGATDTTTFVQSALVVMEKAFGLSADRFRVGNISIESRGLDKWVVLSGGLVLNTGNQWEYEPLPSNRDDAFILRTRFSFSEAYRLALSWA